MRRKFLISLLLLAFAVTPCFAKPMGQIAIFNESVGWTNVGTAAQQTEIFLDKLTLTDAVEVLGDDDVGDFAEANTDDGELDIIITFGYFPVSLYTPGNGDPDDSVGELFLEGGNMFMNTADYIFYVTQGGGANGEQGLKNMTDSNFDMWTDGTAIEPTDDGDKYTPSLEPFTTNRGFKDAQVEADGEWEYEVIFGSSGSNSDPVVIYNTDYEGRVAIWYQVSNDGLPRGDVLAEILNNWLSTVVEPEPVEYVGKLSTTWGDVKQSF